MRGVSKLSQQSRYISSSQIYHIDFSTLSRSTYLNLLTAHNLCIKTILRMWMSERVDTTIQRKYCYAALSCRKYVCEMECIHSLRNLTGTFASTVECPELAFGLLTAPLDAHCYSRPCTYTFARFAAAVYRPSSREFSRAWHLARRACDAY